jgi:hypothetical protein
MNQPHKSGQITDVRRLLSISPEPFPEHLVAMNSFANMKEYTDGRALQEHIKKPN